VWPPGRRLSSGMPCSSKTITRHSPALVCPGDTRRTPLGRPTRGSRRRIPHGWRLPGARRQLRLVRPILPQRYVSLRRQASPLEVLAQLQRTRTLFTRAQLDAARAEFVRHEEEAYTVLTEAQLDAAAAGRLRRTWTRSTRSSKATSVSTCRWWSPTTRASISTRDRLGLHAPMPSLRVEHP